MQHNWIEQTWTSITHNARRPDRIEEFRAAVDIWSHTCEIILAKAPRKHQGQQWDNRRVRSVRT